MAERANEADARWHHVFSRPFGYGPLLALILLTIAFQLAAPESGWARVVTIGLQGSMLLLALWTSRVKRIFVRLAVVVVAAALIGALVVLFGPGTLGRTPTALVDLPLVAVMPAAIATGLVRHVREEQGVSMRTMFGVLCIYLLIGMLFAVVFRLINELGPTSFFTTNVQDRNSNYLYFSFATLTTVGYGDLTVATDLGRSLAITEALLGQIYLVTVVAVIVGNLGRFSARRPDA